MDQNRRKVLDVILNQYMCVCIDFLAKNALQITNLLFCYGASFDLPYPSNRTPLVDLVVYLGNPQSSWKIQYVTQNLQTHVHSSCRGQNTSKSTILRSPSLLCTQCYLTCKQDITWGNHYAKMWSRTNERCWMSF